MFFAMWRKTWRGIYAVRIFVGVGVVSLDDRGLRHVGAEGLRVPQHQKQQRAMPVEFVLERLYQEPIGGAGTLHDGAAGRALPSHEQGHPDQALVPHDGDFRG